MKRYKSINEMIRDIGSRKFRVQWALSRKETFIEDSGKGTAERSGLADTPWPTQFQSNKRTG